uniref:Triokinase/FMN cyclase n=1 Tax=Tetraodon nigroviridis TaxID=99883 RepID=H3CIW3_TETNG
PRKKLINSPDSCVDEALCGLVRANGGLSLLNGHRVVIRSDLNNLKGKVALLSGGGSGHEPAHGGYVGAGMLSAAVAGGVFASPPPASILSAILSLHNAGASGVLLIVKNYTGDRLNFGLATEQARNHGVAAEMVIVADDCAFELPRKAGRRGLCGTVFIHKIAGALAEEGCSLDQIVLKVTEVLKAIGQSQNSGGSLSPCSVPCCLPTFDLPPGDMELGLGIHGEPGIKRSKVASADEVVKTMIDLMTNTNSQSHLPLTSGDSVVVCVNNLGALSSLEMAVITRATINSLESRGMVVARVMCGSFMTSLEMAGFSISLMRTNQETLRLFDTKTSAPFWPNLSSTRVSGHSYITEPEATRPQLQDDTPSEGPLSPVLHKVLVRVCSTLLEKQEELNSLDRAAGDGDCGYTHSQAAKAIQEWLQDHTVPACPGKLLSILAGLVQEKMGGSSGALYSLFLTAAAGHLTAGQNGAAAWADAMLAGTQAVKRYGGADTGDRTMLDALCPAADEMRKLVTSPPSGHMSILQAAVQKAAVGAESTRSLTAKAGRASYIAVERVNLPDPGAMAVAAMFKAVLESLEGQIGA